MRNVINTNANFDAVAVCCEHAVETGMDVARLHNLLDARFYSANPLGAGNRTADGRLDSERLHVETSVACGTSGSFTTSLRGPVTGPISIGAGCNPAGNLMGINPMPMGLHPFANRPVACAMRLRSERAVKQLLPAQRRNQWSTDQTKSPSWQVHSAIG